MKRALADSRLVTLTGVGGAGKSRLAVQVASDLLNEYSDGAWLVELAPLSEPERVPSAVASGLAIPEDPHRPPAEMLAEQSAVKKQLLLVVDNCEHVLAACADLLVGLLGAAPGLRVLATSREELARAGRGRHPGAVAWPFPDQPADASVLAELLSRPSLPRTCQSCPTRLRAHSGQRRGGGRDRPAPGRDPAGPRAGGGAGQGAVAGADRGPAVGPFPHAVRGAQDRTPRQQTLRAAMDWSYDLLDEAGAAPVAAPVGVHGQLHLGCGRCGLRPRRHGGIGRPRCRGAGSWTSPWWSLSRDPRTATACWRRSGSTAGSGWRKPVRARPARAAHRDWCSSMVEAAADQIRGGQQQARWLELLELQHDDLHAALEWSWSRGDPASLQIAVNAAWFWYLRGHWDEARRSLERSIAVEAAEPALQARGSAWAGVFAWRRGDLDQAGEFAEASLQVLNGTGDEGEGLSLLVHTLVAISSYDYEGAEETGRRALEVFRTPEPQMGRDDLPAGPGPDRP